MFMLAGLIILMYMIFEPQRRAAAANEQVHTASERGAHLFAENCVVCHGVQGQGIQGAGFALNTDDNKVPDDDRRAYLRNVLYNGKQNSNGWEPNMPIFLEANGGALNPQMIEDIITFIGCGDWNEVEHILAGELGTPANAIPTPNNFKTPNARILPGAPAATTAASANVDPGALVFEANCITCHKISPEYPNGAGVGPDLTGVAIRKIPSRAPIIPNQIDLQAEGGAEGLTKWIRDPNSIRSGSGMPGFNESQISNNDMEALTKWLMAHTTPAATTGQKSCYQTVAR
jgi:mono/diheme cytochrome c family protein